MKSEYIDASHSDTQFEEAEGTQRKRLNRRKKLLRYFRKSITELSEAIYLAAPSLNVLDSDRIIDCFAEHIDSYPGPDKRSFDIEFAAWGVEWVTKIARLTERLKPLLPQLKEAAATVPGLETGEYGHVAHRVLNRLDEYAGDELDFSTLHEWATHTAIQEAENTVAFYAWLDLHRGAVYDGLWHILKGCADLGADISTVEELSCDVWRWVSENVNLLLQPGAPLHLKLRGQAVWFARAWRTATLSKRDNFSDYDTAEREQIRKEVAQPTRVPSLTHYDRAVAA